MDDDLFIDRLRRKEKFRQMEEERRQRMLHESKHIQFHVEETATEDAPQYANAIKIPTKSEKVTFFDAHLSPMLKNYSFSKPNNGFPANVGYLNLKSSPLSSVSMSQTPEKVRAKRQESKFATRFDPDRSTSSREDCVFKTAIVASGKRKLSFDDDTESEGEDLVILARKKENPQYIHPVHPIESVILTSRASNNETTLKSPRNPLTLMKQENDFEMVRKMSPVSQRQSSESNRQLWSDSGDEKDQQSSRLASRRSSQTKGESLQKEDPATGVLVTLTTYKKNDDMGRGDKPSFDCPKFGPYSLPSPFLLRSDNDDEVYEVPVNICRYLPEYQREGIEFMYRCGICNKKGAILGDGTLRLS
jgi:hypothetical protein